MSGAVPAPPLRLRRTRRKLTAFDIVSACVGIVAAILIIYPMIRTLIGLFVANGRIDLSGIGRAIALPGLPVTLLNTAVILVIAIPVATIVGALFAWINERTNARIGWVAMILPLLPLLVPPVASAIGWVFLISPRAGVLNVAIRDLFGLKMDEGPMNVFSWPTVIVLYVLELIPIAYLIISAALRNLDPALEQASRTAGAGVGRTFVRVTLPAIKPALASAAFLCLTAGLSLYSVPAVIGQTAGINVLVTQIVDLMTKSYPADIQAATALGFLLLVVIGIGWVIQSRIVRGSRHAQTGGKGARAALVDLGVWRRPVQVLLVLFMAIASLLPVIGLLLVSLQHFWSARIDVTTFSLDAYTTVLATNVQFQTGIINSIVLGVLGATICVLISLLVSLLVRERQNALTVGLDGVLKLPSTFSHVVITIGVLYVFAGPPFGITGTLGILLIAYVIIYIPQASIATNSATSQVGKELVEASRVSGSSQLRTLRRVTFPIIVPGLASAWALAFVYIVGDLTASIMLASTSTPTIGYLLLDQFQSGTYPVIAALAMFITLISTVVVVAVLVLTNRRSRVPAARSAKGVGA